jgi:hypothetical protein
LLIAEAEDFFVLVHATLVLRPFVLSLFNTPCDFTPLLNLHPLIFCLTPFGWLGSITLTAYFCWEYFLFTPF